MKITEIEGDLFAAPDGAVLIHACNCLGSWGGGIAKDFQLKYPAAYEVYKAHCEELLESRLKHSLNHSITNKTRTLNLPLGTALIIPPQKDDYEPGTATDEAGGKKRHWIVCLFTSRAYGKSVSPPRIILENSVHAIRDMRRQLEELHENGESDEWDGKIYSCRFNSGLFRVKWEDSKAVLEKELDGMKAVQEVVVVRPEEEK